MSTLKKVAVMPGSFDPITNGHCDIIQRALALFDEIILAIGINSKKNYMFPLDIRKKWLESTFTNEKKIKVAVYTKLTVNFCDNVGAKFIIRGLRNSSDFEFEKSIAHTNAQLSPHIETIFFIAKNCYSSISSNIVKDIIINNGNYKLFVPPAVNV